MNELPVFQRGVGPSFYNFCIKNGLEFGSYSCSKTGLFTWQFSAVNSFLGEIRKTQLKAEMKRDMPLGKTTISEALLEFLNFHGNFFITHEEFIELNQIMRNLQKGKK